MPLQDLATILEPLLSAWKSEGGRRSFGDFVDRAGDERVRDLLGVS
jgi:sulfite reductase (ferredoxin)